MTAPASTNTTMRTCIQIQKGDTRGPYVPAWGGAGVGTARGRRGIGAP